MTRDETIALWLECEKARNDARAEGQSEKEAHQAAQVIWNRWANSILHELADLKSAGKWDVEYKPDDDWYGVRHIGRNNETTIWLKKALVDFSYLKVDTNQKIEQLKFHTVQKYLSADNTVRSPREKLDFEGFIFPSTADFRAVVFLGHANFYNTNFHGTAGFRRTYFGGIAEFEQAIFQKAGWFARTIFSDVAHFDLANFQGMARFASVVFEDDALFSKVKFEKSAYFLQNIFTKRAVFEATEFVGEASFNASKSDSAFVLARSHFHNAPIFNQADFKQAPDLDEVVLPRPAFWKRGNRELTSRYRALRRLAVQGHDYEREQQAFVGELRSRRWSVDKWYTAGLWFSLAYDGISDCGRSISRPFAAWFSAILLFGVVYWALGGFPQICGNSPDHPVKQAFLISLKNASIGLTTSRDQRISAAYECVFGGTIDRPAIPFIGTLAEIIVQVPLSAALIFLFLLAIRNRFKIK